MEQNCINEGPSEIIQYIYGGHNLERIDAFNKANQEIILMLKDLEPKPKPANPIWNGKPLYKNPDFVPKQKEKKIVVDGINPLITKVFDYVINKKLDYDEIMSFDKSFKDKVEIRNMLQRLRKSYLSSKIDDIYRKFGLSLPPFSTRRAFDFNNRGHPYATDDDREESSYSSLRSLNEMRRFIRNVLTEILGNL